MDLGLFDTIVNFRILHDKEKDELLIAHPSIKDISFSIKREDFLGTIFRGFHSFNRPEQQVVNLIIQRLFVWFHSLSKNPVTSFWQNLSAAQELFKTYNPDRYNEVLNIAKDWCLD